jgi:hypothetical protein
VCFALYLFTDDSVPETAPLPPGKVSLEPVVEGKDGGALMWSRPEKYIYYVHGHQGCGCGWAPVGYWEDEADIAAKRGDRLILANLLSALDPEASALVICWEGDQGKALAGPTAIGLDDVRNPNFEFEELREYRVA